MKIKEAIAQLNSIRTYGECYNGTIKVGEIIDLIEWQQAEIERLTEENGWLSKECNKSTTECAELQKQVDGLTEENGQLRLENNDLEANLEKSYEIERANIQAEIACAGTSCHWCKTVTEKDTAKEILGELYLFLIGTTFTKENMYKKIKEKVEEIAKRKGVEVE